jgi:hypothetical protein
MRQSKQIEVHYYTENGKWKMETETEMEMGMGMGMEMEMEMEMAFGSNVRGRLTFAGQVPGLRPHGPAHTAVSHGEEPSIQSRCP